MNANSIHEIWNRRPFEPCEVKRSCGQRHAVMHPEVAILLRTRFLVTDPAADRAAIRSLVPIPALRPIQPQSSAQ